VKQTEESTMKSLLLTAALVLLTATS